MKNMVQELQNIREAAKKTGKNVAILLDTKGPEIRTHNMVNGTIELTVWNFKYYLYERSRRYTREVFCYI